MYLPFFEGQGDELVDCPADFFQLPLWDAEDSCYIATLAAVIAHELMHTCATGEGLHDGPFGWVEELGSPWQKENCDLIIEFSTGDDAEDNLEDLLKSRYCHGESA